MKSLAALLFHPSATAEKADKGHEPKQAHGFAQVLHASLGDSRRDSRSDLASASLAENLPKAEGMLPTSRAATSEQAEDTLVAPTSANPRRARDKSAAQVVSSPESAGKVKSNRAHQGTSKLQRAHRGYAMASSAQTSDAPAAPTLRAETRSLFAPSKANTNSDKRDATASPESATKESLPRPSTQARKLGNESRVHADQQKPTVPSTASAPAATEPSGEETMPPHTSAVPHAPANPDIPSSRLGDRMRPQAWRIAGEGLDSGARHQEDPGALAVPSGQLVEAPAEAPVLVTTLDLDAVSSEPANHATPGEDPPPRANQKAIDHANFHSAVRESDRPSALHTPHAPAAPDPVHPEPPSRFREPSLSQVPSSVIIPPVGTAEADAPVLAQADPGPASVADGAVVERSPVFASPNLVTNTLCGPTEPPSQPQPRTETPSRTHRHDEAALAKHVESKTDGAKQNLPIHASFGPKSEASVGSPALPLISDSRATAPSKGDHTAAARTKASPSANVVLAKTEPVVASPRRPSPSTQGQAISAAFPGQAPQQASSSPAPQISAPVSAGKTVTSHGTLVAQVAVQASHASVLPCGDAGLTAQPQIACPDHGTLVSEVASQPVHERETHEPPVRQSPGRRVDAVAHVDIDTHPTTPVVPAPVAEPTGLPLSEVQAEPVGSTDPSHHPAPQPKVDLATGPAHRAPRSGRPGAHPHSQESAKPGEASAPSAPEAESKPELPSISAESHESVDGETVPAAESPPQGDAAHLPVLAVPSPSVLGVAPAPADRPAPRSDAPTPAVAAATTIPATPGLPTSAAPSASPSSQVEAPQTPRRLWTAKDDRRLPEAPALPAPATQPRPARPHAPAPIPSAPDDTRNTVVSRSPSSHASPSAAPVLSPDRPADLPVPSAPANTSPSDVSALTPSSSAPPAAHAAPVEVRHPPLPHHMAPLVAQAERNDGLNLTVMPHAAHMAIESSDGDLALHLRVRHGSADVTVGGSMAPLFETRAPEARAALASEGLNLGRFDLGQQGGGGQQGQPEPERPEHAPEPATPYRHQSSPSEAKPGDGRIHVTA